MPESPDFETMAMAAIDKAFPDRRRIMYTFPTDVTRCQRAIAEQLRLVWNARGAADRAALGVEFKRAMVEGGGEIRPEEILKGLDR